MVRKTGMSPVAGCKRGDSRRSQEARVGDVQDGRYMVRKTGMSPVAGCKRGDSQRSQEARVGDAQISNSPLSSWRTDAFK
jgi:hypothetical protein